MSPSFPVINAEHLFPDLEDPILILKGLNEYRTEWDRQKEAVEELTQYRKDNTVVYRLLNKSIAGVTRREEIDKRFWFRLTDVVDDPSSIKEEDNDYFMWISSPPDSYYPMDNKYVRTCSLFGMV